MLGSGRLIWVAELVKPLIWGQKSLIWLPDHNTPMPLFLSGKGHFHHNSTFSKPLSFDSKSFLNFDPILNMAPEPKRKIWTIEKIRQYSKPDDSTSLDT